MNKLFSIDFPPPRLALPGRDWILAALFFLAGVFFFTRHNDFPAFYHPDEPSKARQLIQGEFNFNHPLLLLQATRLIIAVEHCQMTPQPVTEAGRLASALFAAGVVSCLVLIAAHLRGTVAAGAVGLLVLANPHLYELAHYMKEDPALTFGMCVFFLALVRCWLGPSSIAFALLGVGAALATSGKYLGALLLLVAILPLWFCRENRARHLGAFLGGFLLVLLAINYPMLASLGTFTTNLDREVGFAVEGHKGLTRSVPHGVYGAVFRDATNPVIWVLLVIYYVSLIIRWRKVHPAERTFALFPIFFVLLLSFSPKTHYRYFLPDAVIFCSLAALGALVLQGPRKIIRPLRAALLGGAIVWSGLAVAARDASFKNDSRRALVAYVRAHIPRDATIVQDKRVNLPSHHDPRQSDSPYFLDQPLLGKLFAADVGTIADLRARHIQYVAVAEGDYGRYFLPTHHALPAEQADYDRRKAFYQQLFAEGQILWQCPAGAQEYLQPAIKLYYLPPAK